MFDAETETLRVVGPCLCEECEGDTAGTTFQIQGEEETITVSLAELRPLIVRLTALSSDLHMKGVLR